MSDERAQEAPAGERLDATFWLGAHKTGTTFLQKSLDLSQDLLRDHDVHYVDLESFRRRWGRPVLNQGHDRSPEPPGPFADPSRRHLVFDENIPGYVQHALSWEGFYPDMTRRVDAIADHLRLRVSEVVVGVRNPVGYLPSLYCEILKSQPFRTFDQFMRESFANDPDHDRCNWHALLRRLVEAHQDATVKVYFHEDVRGNEKELLAAVARVPAASLQLIEGSERPGFSHDAVSHLHELHASRRVVRKDVGDAIRRFPKGQAHPGFKPFEAAERQAWTQRYERAKQAITADPDLSVLVNDSDEVRSTRLEGLLGLAAKVVPTVPWWSGGD